MKTRNKVIIGSGVLFLVMLIAGFSFVSASGPWCNSGNDFHPRFYDKGFHSKFHSKDKLDFILWRLDKKAEELDLTDAQKAKYEELKGNLKTHFSEGMGDRQRLMEQFHTEMSKQDPNVTLLVESVKTKINEMSDFANENLDLFVDFYTTLDSSQQRMITDEIKERMEYHHS